VILSRSTQRYPKASAGSNPYSAQSVELDFSHLRAEGVGVLLTHPLKERRAQGSSTPCCSDLGQEGRSALLLRALGEEDLPGAATKEPN
jgi:hypothetical protein